MPRKLGRQFGRKSRFVLSPHSPKYFLVQGK
jgi:hypothetical protein